MNFASKEDVDAPIDHVFALMSDFESFERAALRRGVEVQRCDELPQPASGMEWQLHFMFRGKARDLTLTLQEYDTPQAMSFRGVSQGVNGLLSVDLVAMSRSRTRLSVELALEATSLPARLVLQSMKLARVKMNKQFHLRIANLASELEDRYRRMS